MRDDALIKYPRTPHIESSRLQVGDEDLQAVPFAHLAAPLLVAEEKLDGANAALSFDEHGDLRLQSRGHFLTGGPRERHFALLKTWAATQQRALRELLGARYVMFGEWLYAKHTIFYDCLPHYFLEFELYDRETSRYLSTTARARLLAGAPVCSVPVLHAGPTPKTLAQLVALVGPSRYKSASWRARLATHAAAAGQDPARVVGETDPSSHGEGLYLKLEDEAFVLGRFKYVRASFLTSVLDSESHWLTRPIVPNLLAESVTLW